MSARYWDNGNFSQPEISQLKQNTRNTVAKERKKGKQPEPVIIEGRKIVNSWWGQKWCDNLEQYADFENRIARGKRYVRAGTVIDLKIEKGRVSARVQGSRKAPYKVEIRISPLSEEKCQSVIARCTRKIESLEELLKGNFPQELKELFTDSDSGLFPAPKEISFMCSCPDWAIMCKHVAAVLYGIGARFDSSPLMFFELRGIDPEKFIDIAIKDRIEKMIDNSQCKSPRIIDFENGNDIFGVF
ncbi:MAG: hypothetical protein MJ177_06170 [Clostridia bacterium]|nr:hypothetical protein [Clostridia bacterium]